MTDRTTQQAIPDLPQPQGFFAAPWRVSNNWDIVSIISFVGAAVFGVHGVCNRIRERFFHAFVMGHGETRTPFSDIIEKYNGNGAILPSGSSSTNGLFDGLSKDYTSGALKAGAYCSERKAMTANFREEIAQRLEKDFQIPTKGIKGYTIGNWKRWEQLGVGARRETALGFATISAIGVGTIAIMRNSKNTLDRVEEKLDAKQGAKR
jgi:hypothetical protein